MITIDSLLKKHDKNAISFHTPGHKNCTDLDLCNINYDLTELSTTFDLFCENKAVLETEKRLAFLFNSKNAIISPFGSSSVIKTAVLSTDCDYFIASSASHKSFIDACVFCQKEIFFVKTATKKGMPKAITLSEIKKIIAENKDKKAAIFITNPDYYGNIFDISKISNFCKVNKISLILDSAHGAHLPFLDKSTCDKNADFIAVSLHKSLPCLTGASALLINNDVDKEIVRANLSSFSSTSPSFLIMKSLANCVDILYKNNKNKDYSSFIKVKKYIKNVNKFAKKLGFSVLSGKNHDDFKIVIDTSKLKIDPKNAIKILEKNKIFIEAIDERYLILFASNCNKKYDFTCLKKALKQVVKKCKKDYILMQEDTKTSSFYHYIPKIENISKIKKIKTKDSENKKSAFNITKCPPGIAIILANEKITKNHIDKLIAENIDYISVVED